MMVKVFVKRIKSGFQELSFGETFSENETFFCFALFIHRTPFNVAYDINVVLSEDRS